MTHPFEFFVETELPGLLRFGYILTGDPEQARLVARTALVRARWRRVRAAADPAGEIRRAMAREYARRPVHLPAVDLPADAQTADAQTADAQTADAQTRGEPTSSAPLRGAFDALPPRQRAVTVLRYAEDLSDETAARALGVDISAAKHEAARALRELRAAFPAEARPTATDVSHDLRELLATMDTGVSAGDLTVADVTRAAARVRLRRRWGLGMGVVGIAAVIGVLGALVTRGNDDVAVASDVTTPTPAATAPSVGRLGEVDTEELTEVTPDDFVIDGLAIGMTDSEVEAEFGNGAVFYESSDGTCARMVQIGADIRGWFDWWPPLEPGEEPDPDAEPVLVEVAYYGRNAKTVAGIAVGMHLPEAEELAENEVVPTALGDGMHSVQIGGSTGETVVGIGYRSWPPGRCMVGIAVGPMIEEL